MTPFSDNGSEVHPKRSERAIFSIRNTRYIYDLKDKIYILYSSDIGLIEDVFIARIYVLCFSGRFRPIFPLSFSENLYFTLGGTYLVITEGYSEDLFSVFKIRSGEFSNIKKRKNS